MASPPWHETMGGSRRPSRRPLRGATARGGSIVTDLSFPRQNPTQTSFAPHALLAPPVFLRPLAALDPPGHRPPIPARTRSRRLPDGDKFVAWTDDSYVFVE